MSLRPQSPAFPRVPKSPVERNLTVPHPPHPAAVLLQHGRLPVGLGQNQMMRETDFTISMF